MKATLLVLILLLPMTAAADHDADARVLRILEVAPLIDGHNDFPRFRKRFEEEGAFDFNSDLSSLEDPPHTDIPRLRRGGVGAQFWVAWVPIREHGGASGDTSRFLQQMDFIYEFAEGNPEHLEIAYSSSDMVRIMGNDRIASLIGIEGGHAIEDSLGTLRMLYRGGARYMTLTHRKGLRWVDSSEDTERVGGLTPFGKDVVREMNRLGMLVDLSHVSVRSAHAVLDVSEAPVIFSHSGAHSVTHHARNVPDDVLERLAENGGIVMITFFPMHVSAEVRDHFEAFTAEVEKLRSQGEDEEAIGQFRADWIRENPAPRPTVQQVADHIDHVKALIGVEHIGIGSDFDGMPPGPGPIGLEDVSAFPNLFRELIARGYSDEELELMANRNFLRVFAEVERIGERLRQTTPPFRSTEGAARAGQPSWNHRELQEFATRYAAAWSGGDPAALADFYAENGAFRINEGEASIGRAAIEATVRSFMTGFPDMVVRLVEVQRAGDSVEFHWHWTGTNTGPGGTGNSVELYGFEQWTFDSDGLIVRTQGNMDDAEYQRQLHGDPG